MINYFASKTVSSFKSSKQYWRFYSNYVKSKSSNINNNSPYSISIESQSLTKPLDIANGFNKFFTTLATSSNKSYAECFNYLDKHYNPVNKKIVTTFSFRETTETIVAKAIKNLDASMVSRTCQ